MDFPADGILDVQHGDGVDDDRGARTSKAGHLQDHLFAARRGDDPLPQAPADLLFPFRPFVHQAIGTVLPFYLQALRAQRRLYPGGRGLDGPLPGGDEVQVSRVAIHDAMRNQGRPAADCEPVLGGHPQDDGCHLAVELVDRHGIKRRWRQNPAWPPAAGVSLPTPAGRRAAAGPGSAAICGAGCRHSGRS